MTYMYTCTLLTCSTRTCWWWQNKRHTEYHVKLKYWDTGYHVIAKYHVTELTEQTPNRLSHENKVFKPGISRDFIMWREGEVLRHGISRDSGISHGSTNVIQNITLGWSIQTRNITWWRNRTVKYHTYEHHLIKVSHTHKQTRLFWRNGFTWSIKKWRSKKIIDKFDKDEHVLWYMTFGDQ